MHTSTLRIYRPVFLIVYSFRWNDVAKINPKKIPSKSGEPSGECVEKEPSPHEHIDTRNSLSDLELPLISDVVIWSA